MRMLGFGALVLLILSFIFWIIEWTYFHVFMQVGSYETAIYRIMEGVAVASALCDYLAMLLIAIGLVIGGRSLQRLSTPSATGGLG